MSKTENGAKSDFWVENITVVEPKPLSTNVAEDKGVDS